MAAIKTAQLKGQLAGILKKYPDAQIIGLKSANRWQKASEVEVEEQLFWVTQCDSQLAIRKAILKPKKMLCG
jgi:hypothetical protein